MPLRACGHLSLYHSVPAPTEMEQSHLTPDSLLLWNLPWPLVETGSQAPPGLQTNALPWLGIGGWVRGKHRKLKETQRHRKEDAFLGPVMNRWSKFSLIIWYPTSMPNRSMRLFIPGQLSFSALEFGLGPVSWTLNTQYSVLSVIALSSFLHPPPHGRIFLDFFHISRNFRNWGLQVLSV